VSISKSEFPIRARHGWLRVASRAHNSVYVQLVDHAAQNFLSPAQLAAWKLGIAQNPYGDSRADLELTKAHEAAKAKTQAKPPSG
jgi:hypothetical protein